MAESIPQKQCSRCKQPFPATTEYFHRSSDSKDGLKSRCKPCQSEYAKQYRAKNGDRVRAVDASRRDRNRDEINAVRRKWRDAHKDEVQAYHREYYAKRREWNSERKKKAYRKNKAKFNRRSYLYHATHQAERSIYQKQYYKSHKQQAMLKRRLQIARLRSVPGSHTVQDLHVLYDGQGGKCCYCGKDLHGKYEVDHIIPLSRKGSSNSKENLALACRSCNRRKHAKTPEEWLRYRQEIEWI